MIAATRQPFTHRVPSFVAIGLLVWIGIVALVVAVASVPAFRPSWSVTRRMAWTGGALLVSEPVTAFVTPYVSFARVSVGSARTATDVPGLELTIAAGEDPLGSPADLGSRTLAILPLRAEGGVEHTWSSEPRQFDPAAAVRLVLTGTSQSVRAGTGDVRVTVGYDGTRPAVRAVRYWWPWLAASATAGFALLLWPSTWRVQERIWRGARDLFAGHRPVILLVVVSALVRALLAARGGQYFDADEARYLGALTLFDRLSTGNVGAAFEILFDSPDHPGFRLIGLLPASVHTAAAFLSGRPALDAREATGEWLAAGVLSMAAVCSLALTYAVALRAGASRQESFLAAFLLACCASMLVYARHFYPYDAAMALCLLALWIGMNSPDRHAPIRSYVAGAFSGLGFITYTGYWLLAAIVGALHVLQRPAAIRPSVHRALFFSAGLVTVPGLLVVVGFLRGRPFLAAVIEFSQAVVHGDFSEGWSLPWEYFWHIEHVMLAVLAVGVLAAASCLRRNGEPAARARRWLLAAAAVYAGLVVASTVLHEFVVYDRLARQMLPFLCLAAAAGFVSVIREPRFSSPRTLIAYGLLAVVSAASAVPLFRQQFPRDIALDAVRRYGKGTLRISSILEDTTDHTVPIFLPAETDDRGGASQARYLLLNGKDLWIESGRIRATGVPPGRVLYTALHPRQLRSYQYHGYSPAQRALIRTLDVSMKLIDTKPESAER